MLFQTHCWDRAANIEETLHAFNDLVRTGKVHYIGVSNVTGGQLQKIVETNKKFGYPQIVSLQASLLVVRWWSHESIVVFEDILQTKPYVRPATKNSFIACGYVALM